MLFSNWLRNRKKSLKRWIALRQERRQRSTTHPLIRTLLCLEVLEDRITPSSFQSLYSFTGGNDGKVPEGTLMVDRNGNLDGTTSAAGANGFGTVFRLNPSSNVLTTLHSFSTSSGYLTYQGVIQDSTGNLYGTTVNGGSDSEGTVFKLSPDGTFTIIHNFIGNTNHSGDGAIPEAPLIMDGKGNLFGTTSEGGTTGFGTVFELSPNGTGGYNYTTLHSFNGSSDGSYPVGSLLMDSSGNLYGIAVQGGADSDGTVFQLSPNEGGGYSFSVLHTFTGGNDGAQPYSNLVMDSKGNLYGTTTIDGPHDLGTVYEITPSSNTFTTIYGFQGPDGYNPTGNILIDPKGNIYGVTEYGGSGNEGTVFELSPNGPGGFDLTTLHNFSGSDGGTPLSGLTADSIGNVYGTTNSGGTNEDGTIFELPGAIAGLTATTANNVPATFSTNTQNVTLTANVISGSTTVNEGTVTFTVLQGSTVIGQATTSDTVSDGQASVSYALPANLVVGAYTIDAVYNPGSDFSGSSDSSHTLTIGPAKVTTTAASPVSATYNTTSQSLLLNASVADASISTDTVSEGTVTFTVKNSNGITVGTSVQGVVSKGKASADFTLPAGQAAGSYSINVSYTDAAGNFIDSGDTAGALTVSSSSVLTTANNISTAYSAKARTVTLTANVKDDLDPKEAVNEGTVTFTIKQGSTAIGTVQGAVLSNGTASANFNLPAGQLLGSYAINVSYNDSLGNFIDGGDTPGTLTITSAGIISTASNAATVFRTSSQSVKLTAGLTNASSPTNTVNEGTVTFTILDGSKQIGSIQAAVSNGLAIAYFTLSAGQSAGNYAINVGYSDGTGKFTDGGDNNATLTIAHALVATTANDGLAIYSPKPQTVALSAAVTDITAPTDIVSEGAVTFTILNGNAIVGSTQGTVSNGIANANFDMPGGLAAGSYTIAVSYSDSQNNFGDGGDTKDTLVIKPANVITAAATSAITYNTTAQTLPLNATITDTSNPTDIVGEGIVTFTIKNSQGIIGSLSAPVIGGTSSGGTASANFNWPAGQAAGSYAIAVSYSDSAGNFTDNGDAGNTLTVATALLTTTAVNASAVYSPNAQTVTLSANVASPGMSSASLDAGTVVFTIENGGTIIGSVQGMVSNGTANAGFALPAGLAAGSYAIAVSYSDSHGNFIDNGDSDTSATLRVAAANVATTASNTSVVFPTSQSVTLNAIVVDTSNPNDTVNEGAVAFTILNGSTTVGSATGTVSNGTASVDFNLPAGLVAGNYTIAVSYTDSNKNFSDNGDTSAILTVDLAPTVTDSGSPKDETVQVGGTAAFTAAATGTPTPTVQWQVSTDGGKTFNNVSGAASTTLTLTNVQASQNGYQYQAVFTNSNGTATTSAATLTVQYAPTVTSNPSSQTVSLGQNVTFTAAANGSPTPAVQWQVSTEGGKTFANLSDGTNVSGATSATLTLSNVQASQNGYQYQAVFTNSLDTATTAAATLSVQYAPIVTTNPSSQTATAGQKVTFTAAVSANPAATVQWQASTDGGATFKDINGAINPTLTLAGIATDMSGYEYQAVFTNSIGSTTTSAATLTVNPAVLPVITVNPASQTVSPSGTVSFTASTSSGSPAAVQWQASTDGGINFSNISGATGTTLTLTGVTLAMNGYKYQAVFSNSSGNAVSFSATLTVNGSASPSSHPQVLNVPPLLALLDQLIGGIETVNANGTETVVYSLFGISLITVNYDSSGNFLSASLFGFSIPNSVWYL
jgi:uncharacterized repeat protein (TIGR03803 family)